MRPSARRAAERAAVIRDAEIEQLLRDYTQPILRAAGLAQQNIQVVIINERAFNAFVMDGRRIFINAGALIDRRRRTRSSACSRTRPATSPADTCRGARAARRGADASIIAMLLGVGALVAAGGSGN